MTVLVTTLLVFVAVGVLFLVGNLMLGRLLRPRNPTPEKGAIYECGEEPVGTAWIQFDLRFYVVALLFVIFDVEIAFFFPWAVVFGSSVQLANDALPLEQRTAIVQQIDPAATVAPPPEVALTFARFAFLELLVFFGVILVGFAYLWKRGDLEWVRSLAGQVSERNNHKSETAVSGPAEINPHAAVH